MSVVLNSMRKKKKKRKKKRVWNDVDAKVGEKKGKYIFFRHLRISNSSPKRHFGAYSA